VPSEIIPEARSCACTLWQNVTAQHKHCRQLGPKDAESFAKDKATIASVAPDYVEELYGVSVGSETLYRGVFDGDQLLQKIIEIKNVLPEGVRRIGTADTWNKIVDGTADAIAFIAT
jgi:exo-beta-1,3-glucanase (GH17 family)